METNKYKTEQNPLKISVVVDIIKDFIDCPKTLHACKLVDKNWNDCFKKKTFKVLTIKNLSNVFHPYPKGLGYNSATNEFHSSLKNEVTRLHIHDKKELLSQSNVIQFFENKGRLLRFLSLKIEKWEWSAQEHMQFLENVLKKWCPMLEELKLIGVFHPQKSKLNTNGETKEIGLKKLILDYSENDCFTSPFTYNITKLARNLLSFVYLGNVFEETLHNISVQMMKEITMCSKQLTTLEFCNVTIGKAAFDAITNAALPLKKFVFEGSHMSDLQVSDLNKFVLSYSDSMQHFHMHFNSLSELDKQEFNVHLMTKLKILQIKVHNINVAASGLMGNMHFLRRMVLCGSVADWSFQHPLQVMFKHGNCPTLRFLSLDESYIHQVYLTQKLFPNLQELDVTCPLNRFCDLNHCLDKLFDANFVLKKLVINVNFSESNVDNEKLCKYLIVRFCGYKAHSLMLATLQDLNMFPPIHANWIEEGLCSHSRTFFSIELKGFKIRDIEIASIARVFIRRSNFLKLSDCNVVADNGIGSHFIKEETLFSYNVDAKISEIKGIVKNDNTNLVKFSE